MQHNRLFFDLLWSLLLYMKMLMFRLLAVRKHPVLSYFSSLLR